MLPKQVKMGYLFLFYKAPPFILKALRYVPDSP
jgi:hypothetical protein